MELGQVKWFATKKGFGCITPDKPNAEDLFVHQADIKMDGFRKLTAEQRVSFLTVTEEGKLRASNVMPLTVPERASPKERGDVATPPAKSKTRKSPEKKVAKPEFEAAPYPVAAEMAIAEKAKGKKGKKPKTIEWTEAVVPEVIKRAAKHGWEHKDTKVGQGHMVILHKPNPNSAVTTIKLNIWCTTGTIGSYLVHPKKGKTQLFRIPATTWEEVEEVFINPRVHTDRGYSKEEDKPEPAAATTTTTKPAPAAEKKGKKQAAKPTTTAPTIATASPGAQTGKVRFYDARVKFFGFITSDVDGTDVHVRRNSIKKGCKLYPGTAVEFVRIQTPRGAQARKVKTL